MARKKVEMKTRPRPKASPFADDTIARKKGDFPTTSEGSGRAGAKSVSTALDEPSARPLAKRGSTSVAKPTPRGGLPAKASGDLGDVDFSKWWKKSPKSSIAGGIRGLAASALAEKAGEVAGVEGQKIATGIHSRNDVGSIADINKKRPSGNTLAWKGDMPSAVVSKAAPAPTPKPAAPKPAAPKPAAPKPAAPKPTATVKPARTSTKPVPRASKPSRADVEREAFMKDLRESARKMKDTSSEMTGATGRMKEKMGEFAGSFKKGGSVKSRGDGIAQRGKTKGRFV